MNNNANLAKHRIVAPNVSRVSEESCDGQENFADSNAAKKSRLQQCKEANEQNRQFIDRSAAKKSRLQQCKEANEKNGQFIDRSAANKNQSRAKVTLGELVLNKKGLQRHSGQNAAKPNSATTSISSGSRKQLFLVDEEDEDDVRSQDVNEREIEEVTSEDDDNEGIEDDFQSHDVNDADRENCGVEDENENIELLFDHSDNEIEDDGSEDDFENDDVELKILQVPQSQKKTAFSTTKKRGPTMMHNIHTQKLHEAIICNEFGQPIGPITEEKDLKHCLTAKARRMSQKNMHTAGPKSFARIREDMKNEDPNKEPPSLTKLFERTRERKEGHVYADTYDETERLIEKMKNYQAPEEDGGGQDVSGPVDPFLAVMNKEYNGHRRLFGKGVTNKLIKKVNGGETSYMVPTELMESVKTGIDAEMKRLVEMRKQIEDDHE